MSLKQICFVSVFFLDDEDEPTDPNIILEEPDDEASKSDKDVSDATGLPLDFYRGREGKDMLFSISPKWILPNFHGLLTEEEMREDPGLDQVGLAYRAVSAVGVIEDVLVRFIVGYDILVDCWERPLYSKYAFLGALRSAAQMVPYEVSIGIILIVRLVSTFGSTKAIARIFP
ncbi:unnamed protein product [Triticum turgidum subsp. durum]|uniref:Uncharacterized protein n=1 Tax=Triticum turgidum subsp. durum TaxID=4567 RepID=A0A9R1QXX5_TRITD|nr:unnamed protein product [Triticum turgidum subsp. durum]